MSKLIVLVSSSPNDYGLLRTKRGLPSKTPVYFDCETGTRFGLAPIMTPRLLCLTELRRSQNEEEDKQKLTTTVDIVLDGCRAFDSVIGTHTKTNAPNVYLYEEKLNGKCKAIQNYGTGSPNYSFVLGWCKELRKDSPNAATTQGLFDQLYDNFEHHRQPWPQNQLNRMKHDVDNLLSPLRWDAEGWRDSGCSRDYFSEIHKRRAGDTRGTFLAEVRKIMSGKPNNLIEEARAAVADGGGDSETFTLLIANLRKWVPDSDEPDLSAFANAMLLLQGFGSGDFDLARDHLTEFLAWQNGFQDSLDELVNSLRTVRAA